MVENQRVITKVYFPRLLLPMSSVVSGLVDLAFGFIVFLGMMVYYRIAPGPAILLMPLFLLLAVLTALGVGLWLSALNAIYRDVRYVVPFLIQFWMFASPVAYPSSLVPERWRWALRSESHGWSSGGLPLVSHRPRTTAQSHARRIGEHGSASLGGRSGLLSEDGRHDR